MKIELTPIENCFVITPQVFEDERGYFYESFNQNTFKELTGLSVQFVQDNISFSKYGVIRGLHAQKRPFAQAKLVRVTQGKVLDVVVDLRKGSPSYGTHFSITLSDENKKQLFVPKGLLHGFAVLSETAKFSYKCDAFYHKDAEYGIKYNDADLKIDWRIPENQRIVSEKDQNLPLLKNLPI